MMKLKNLKMRPKLILLLVLVALLPLLIGGWQSSRLTSEALMQKSFDQLVAIREIKMSRSSSPTRGYGQAATPQAEDVACPLRCCSRLVISSRGRGWL